MPEIIKHEIPPVSNCHDPAIPGSKTSCENGVATHTSSFRTRLIDTVLEQWFLIALGVLITIASQVQVPLEQQAIKRTLSSYLCISIIFFM